MPHPRIGPLLREDAVNLCCILEHSGADTLLYARDFPDACARGASLEEALAKLPQQLRAYAAWSGRAAEEPFALEIVQEKRSALAICDDGLLFSAASRILSWKAGSLRCCLLLV